MGDFFSSSGHDGLLRAVAAPELIKSEVLAALAQSGERPGRIKFLREWSVFCFESLTSTMDAADLLARGHNSQAFEQASLGTRPYHPGSPALVVSGRQEKGRGREGRVWLSPPFQGIYATFLFFPERTPEKVIGCSLVVGLAVQQFVSSLGVEARLKWPNDVLARPSPEEPWRKLSGVLIELSTTGVKPCSLAVGVGLNIAQRSFPAEVPGVSLLQLLGRELDYATVLAGLSWQVAEYMERYFRTGFAEFLEQYSAASLSVGALVGVPQAARGVTGAGSENLRSARVKRIAADGALVVNYIDARGCASEEEVAVYGGEVSVLQYNAG